MSFQGSSEFNKAPGSYNAGQQYINPQPSVGRFSTEVPTFFLKGSSVVPGITKSMAPQSNQGNLQDQSQTENSAGSSVYGNPSRFQGPGSKLFNALPTKKNFSK